ncbi:hypothetical protein HRM2_33730 [Desulforapulum autotrophicum HRM2]|uniref:Uncharacterized protein n=1 Tax=Desulforapulum autotrophicum (strain ATCC 43914 / DSM 3382 / VKM B-1955 / HRM2) TaxID=177437 RepID=C0QMD1_DESAH|nr:hypothetical protein HRM2_33730 [Desulforapulum autotrophicum HRM2]
MPGCCWDGSHDFEFLPIKHNIAKVEYTIVCISFCLEKTLGKRGPAAPIMGKSLSPAWNMWLRRFKGQWESKKNLF